MTSRVQHFADPIVCRIGQCGWLLRAQAAKAANALVAISAVTVNFGGADHVCGAFLALGDVWREHNMHGEATHRRAI